MLNHSIESKELLIHTKSRKRKKKRKPFELNHIAMTFKVPHNVIQTVTFIEKKEKREVGNCEIHMFANANTNKYSGVNTFYCNGIY